MNLLRALRIEFLSVSILPFIFGSLVDISSFKILTFCLGMICVIFMHLSANLINDYADSCYGADNIDKRFYKLFGGSKLIQEGVYSKLFFLRLSIGLALVSFIMAISLSILVKSFIPVVSFLVIVFLGWSYSVGFFRFVYRRTGELIIFTLFGPAIVMGAFFLQTGVFPSFKAFILSIPFGFLTTSILFANEVADFPEDRSANKLTWVSITGDKKAYILYLILMVGAFLFVIFGMFLGFLNFFSIAVLLLLPLLIKATNVIKHYYNQKQKLILSSKITILIHNVVSIILIIDILL